MNRTKTIIAIVAGLLSLSACGGSKTASFNEQAVKDAIVASGKFPTAVDQAGALSAFRYTCATPDISINEDAVYDMIVNADNYPAEFIATAQLGCPNKFVHVQEKIDNGDCFGGPLAGC